VLAAHDIDLDAPDRGKRPPDSEGGDGDPVPGEP
jgi:hypothetical protein